MRRYVFPAVSGVLALGAVLAVTGSFSCGRGAVAVYRRGMDRLVVKRDRLELIGVLGRARKARTAGDLEIKSCAFSAAGGHLLAVLGWPGAERGERLAIYTVGQEGIERVWLDENRGFNPWKVEAGDLDGDGCLEACVGVWKKARHDPVYANRLHVYAWTGGRLRPRWFGTRLSGPLLDFALYDLDRDGAAELIALELAPGGRRRLMGYEWHQFGFAGRRMTPMEAKHAPFGPG